MADTLLRLAAEKISFKDLDPVNLTREETESKEPQINNVREFPPNRGRGQGQKRGGQRYFSQQENKQGPNRPGRNQNGNDGARRGRGTFNNKKNNYSRPFVTNEMAGVLPGACLKCGDVNHHFRSDKCIYKDSELMSSPCRFCGIGAHRHSACVRKEKEGAWPRKF